VCRLEKVAVSQTIFSAAGLDWTGKIRHFELEHINRDCEFRSEGSGNWEGGEPVGFAKGIVFNLIAELLLEFVNAISPSGCKCWLTASKGLDSTRIEENNAGALDCNFVDSEMDLVDCFGFHSDTLL
jgi:hypothetical protein